MSAKDWQSVPGSKKKGPKARAENAGKGLSGPGL
jgi:hypothetical protein